MAYLEEKKSGAFLIKWRINGALKSEYLPVGFTKAQAEVKLAEKKKWEKERKIGMHMEEDGVRKTVRTLSEFLHGFKDDDGEFVVGFLEWRRGDKPDSTQNFEHVMGRMEKVFGHLPIADDKQSKAKWRKAFNNWEIKRKQEVTVSTIWGEWKDLTSALYRACETGGKPEGTRWDLSFSSPITAIKISMTKEKKKVRREKVIFSPEQLEKIYAADPENADLWRFIANTGLRRKELKSLPTFCVDLGDHNATLRVMQDPDLGLEVKDNESRNIPLCTEARSARDAILAKIGDSDYFTPAWHERTWSAKFTKARKAAKLKRGSLHNLRHTFISRCANNGVQLHLVMDWAGHNHLETTKGYLHTPPDYEFLEMKMMEDREAAKVVEFNAYKRKKEEMENTVFEQREIEKIA